MFKVIKRRLGISDIVSTIILVSALLIISIVIMFVAHNIFAYQSQNVEFEQAKDVYMNLAEIIEEVSGKQGASGYVRINTVSGGPYFETNVDNIINITVYSETDTQTIYSSSYNILKYRAGSLVGVSGREDLRGTDSLIVVNNEYPLGNVYTIESNGAWVVINYSRIGILNLGIFNFTKGLNESYEPVFDTLNVVEVHYIELVPGSFTGSGSLYIVATCKNITVEYYRINTTGTLTFIVENSTGSENYILTLDENYDTLVIFVKSIVEINIFGG